MLLFPPETKEIQLDEKWSFVGKKEKNCTKNEKELGEQWDYVAIDAESRLVLSVVIGKRTPENCKKIVKDVYERTGRREDVLITSDCFSSYKTAIKEVYGQEIMPERKPGSGRPPQNPIIVMPEELCYATVCKEYEKGNVSSIRREVKFGTEDLLCERLEDSKVSTNINTSFVERNNGTDRRQNSRKVRDTYGFSKDLFCHISVSFLIFCLYNFCWCLRTLSIIEDGKTKKQTPAMVAKLATHIWSIEEWITYPVYLGDENLKDTEYYIQNGLTKNLELNAS